MYDDKFLPKLSQNLLEILEDNEFYDITIEVVILRYIYGGRLSLEDFFNLTSKEYLHKVYPYKKIIPKDLRENLFKHFLDQPNNNSEPKTTKEIDSIATKQENLSAEKDFSIIIDEINDFIYKLLNKGIDRKFEKQKVIEYFNNHNINPQEIYNWLLTNNNQIGANSIFLFGYFHYRGIVASENYVEALNLFTCALAQDHKLAQYFIGECYMYGHGTIKNENLAFKYYENAADKNILCGQNSIGYCYENGLGSYKNLKKAFYWYEKSANNGNAKAMLNVGLCYIDGKGVAEDYNKAFELFKQSAERGYSSGINMLGYCYDEGFGTKMDKQKAFELYQNAANLEEEVAQYNLALMYENGYGITKDIDKAIYWYNKSAKQGFGKAKNYLKRLRK
ncbi:kinase-like domain-containing protein [Rhizophagus clarus]|uniref:Kinase-like domain-containing protein n=1 Tax=Rhizophagus clarus TaxID=94130 RepID=A0A8H3M9M8_9GLOM|nr:kinase-like domain-containing protein [Rhizophagus clarus]